MPARARHGWIAGPLAVWVIIGLLGCAGPVGWPTLLSVEAAVTDDGRGAWTPVMSTALTIDGVTAQPAVASGLPAPTATPEPPVTAPEAGQRLAQALPAPRRAPQPLASLFLSLSARVQRGVARAEATSTPTALPEPTAAPAFNPPERIRSESIGLDIDIVPVGWKQITRDGKTVSVWEVGSYHASWHKTSAMPGQTGNMVVTGHNNIEGSVFMRLPDLSIGDTIEVEAGDKTFAYAVEEMFVVQEKDASLEQRIWNGHWIGAFPDERMTLVTCYPPDGNSHRMIVIAKPVAS